MARSVSRDGPGGTTATKRPHPCCAPGSSAGALRLAGPAARLGLYGFGTAGHVIAQVALAQGREVFVFTRQGDTAALALALALGVHGAAAAGDKLAQPLDAAILFAPVGELVPLALSPVAAGGRVVCAGIHMSEIPRFPYALLWGERSVCSVANLTREDGETFFAWAERHPLKLSTTSFPLAQANEALAQLRDGRITGAAVLRCGVEQARSAAPAGSWTGFRLVARDAVRRRPAGLFNPCRRSP